MTYCNPPEVATGAYDDGDCRDEFLQELPHGLPPARMYVDEEDSYASNENAINWNAPLVFLLAGATP